MTNSQSPDEYAVQEKVRYLDNLPEDEVEKMYEDVCFVEEDQERNPFYYFTPLLKQKRFIDYFERHRKALFGGNQSGKTTTGAWTVINDCVSNPNHYWWCGSETWEVSRLVLQFKVYEMLPWDKVAFASYTQEKGFYRNIIKFKNGSTISFRSYDQQAKRWQGATLHGIWLDEECPWEIYQECLPRLAKNNGWLIFTMTAISGYTRMVEEVLYSSNIKCFFISTYDNTISKGGALTDAAIEDLESAIEDKDRVPRLQGIPKPKTGLVFERIRKEYPLMIPLDKEHEANFGWPTIVSIDPHPNTPHAALWISVDPHGDVWVWREKPWLLKEKSLEKAEWIPPKEFVHYMNKISYGRMIAKKLIDKYAANQKNAVTGTSIMDEFVRNDFICDFSGGEVDTKIIVTQQYLRDNRIHIFESCWNLWWELLRYIWEPHISAKVAARKEEKQRPRKKNDHLIDCLMNALLYIRQQGGVSLPLPTVQRNPMGHAVINERDMHQADAIIGQHLEENFMEQYQ